MSRPGRESGSRWGGSWVQLRWVDKLVPQATKRDKWGLRADEEGWGVVSQLLEV